MSRVDSDTKAVLRDLDAIKPLSKGDPDIAVVRRAYDEVFAAWTAPALKKTNEHWVSNCALGADREALMIEPASSNPDIGTLVLIHGGGWSLGTAVSYAPLGRWLCAETGMRVLVPDFPQAPEHTAPAAFDALTSFLEWTASKYGSDISLVGDSAGGNLAAVLSNHPPDGVQIKTQILLYPVIDLRPDANYKSRIKFGRGRHFLTADGIAGAAAQYCGENVDPVSPRVSPILEKNFVHTPPTRILIPEFDPLHDECLAYAQLLKKHQVETKVVVADGTIHGCASFNGRIRSARLALLEVCSALL
jgi:acetyl esterase